MTWLNPLHREQRSLVTALRPEDCASRLRARLEGGAPPSASRPPAPHVRGRVRRGSDATYRFVLRRGSIPNLYAPEAAGTIDASDHGAAIAVRVGLSVWSLAFLLACALVIAFGIWRAFAIGPFLPDVVGAFALPPLWATAYAVGRWFARGDAPALLEWLETLLAAEEPPAVPVQERVPSAP